MRETNTSFAFAHRLFDDQAHVTPEAPALIRGNVRFSYDELRRGSNRIARYLKSIGIGPEKAVGVCVGRCCEMIVGCLAIMKAGGVYVPLDPLLPVKRLQVMVAQTHLAAVLTSDAFISFFSETPTKTINFDSYRHIFDCMLDEDVEIELKPDNLSHIVFTSGTTGVPKGVMMPHQALSANIQQFTRKINISEEDCYLHTASLAFTSSLRQMFAPLTQGARVVIAGESERTDPEALFRLIKEQRVTIWDTVAPLLETLVASLFSTNLGTRTVLMENDLRLLLSSGGELSTSLVESWREMCRSQVRIVSMYGQTETVGNILLHEVMEGKDDIREIVPLGRPLDGVCVYILDDNCNRLPDGMPGQIYIGGEIMARGYLGDAELTSEHFIPDPFGELNEGRLYKTGDMGLQSAGITEFKGRSAFRANIRGFRIEFGEVESVIKMHPAIANAAAGLFEILSGGKELIVYFEVNFEFDEPTVDELRAFIAENLPEYMIPLKFMRLDTLPRLSSGKIDRRNLPDPISKRPEMSNYYVAPSNLAELAVAEIWQDVLNLDKVGVYDNFMDLGGTSLLAAQASTRLKSRFNRNITAATMFERPTVHALSQLILGSATNLTAENASINRGKIRKAARKKRK